ncbi:phosphatase PAP2 family protein [Paenibacillus phocaensis]|uniref:phosphatase PAP2 family protein n=1 Tax=Paenibacillus phocaensis TaxID=1776378 RepID=UPI000839D2A3|nr:phosphatase PAP2 family protein [Paenibacillus phocaensis]
MAMSGLAWLPVCGAGLLLILLLIASRLYLGVHYASDIVGGFLAGAVVAVICSWGAVRQSRR